MNRKLGAVIALTVAGGALAFLALGDLGNNLVYYWSPSELVAQKAKAEQGAIVRLGGMVEPGTVQQTGDTLTFKVTDGAASVSVASTGVPPQMFREGIGVVVEGTLAKDGTFHCDRLMVKHDNEYKAPKEGEHPDVNALGASVAEGGS